MPSGKQILFKSYEGNEKSGVWLLPINGGPAEKILQLDCWTIGILVHPDGKQIGLTTMQSLQEIWMMKDFLPKD